MAGVPEGIVVLDQGNNECGATRDARCERRYREALRAWSELRSRDMVMLAASTALENCSITEGQFWEIASGMYRGYSELQHDFESRHA